MEVLELEQEEYKRLFLKDYQIFISADFCALNQDKVDNVYYLGFKDSRFRLGLIVGAKNNQVLSPFSAPFGGFTYIKGEIKISQIECALEALENWASCKNYRSIKVVLPPEIYNPTFIAKQINVFYRQRYSFINVDLNYALDTGLVLTDYQTVIWRNARKNLNIGFRNELDFEKCKTAESQKEAYVVIQKNRNARGFPLRMSWEEVSATAKIIKADFFLCKNAEGITIASAIVFYVSDTIVQVIYWGDLPEYSENKPMNYLSFKVFKHYLDLGISLVDVGPSTENSLPNYGLGEFKESIGCFIQPKYSFFKELV